jgi:large subunit ribosomal protein L22
VAQRRGFAAAASSDKSDDLLADLLSELEEEEKAAPTKKNDIESTKLQLHEGGADDQDDFYAGEESADAGERVTKRHRRRHRLSPWEASSRQKNVRGSVRKVRLMADLVSGLNYNEAMAQLSFAPHRAAKSVQKALHNARHHAEHNLGLDPDRLLVHRVTVGKGMVLGKVKFCGRGKIGRRDRRYSNLEVFLRYVPRKPGERRLGRAGRIHEELRRPKTSWRKKLLLEARAQASTSSISFDDSDASVVADFRVIE